MRIYLALAAMLLFAGEAKAQDIRHCSMEADARALRGQDRIDFEARCKAARAGRFAKMAHRTVTPADAEVGWGHRVYPQCSGNIANTLIGACPLCVPLVSLFEYEKRCYVQ